MKQVDKELEQVKDGCIDMDLLFNSKIIILIVTYLEQERVWLISP